MRRVSRVEDKRWEEHSSPVDLIKSTCPPRPNFCCDELGTVAGSTALYLCSVTYHIVSSLSYC